MTVISNEPEDALVVHNQYLEGYTFTRQSIYETVPTEDRLAKVSEIHGDYIEDEDGNKICADRTVEIVEQGEQSWTLTDGTNTYTLTGTHTSANWSDGSHKYEL